MPSIAFASTIIWQRPLIKMEDESLSSTDASSSYFDCGGGLPLSFTLPSTFDTAQLAGVDPPSTPSTATLLAAPTPSSKPVNYSLYHQASSAHLTAMPTSGSPMSRACLSSMLHERRDTATTAKHSMDALKTNKYHSLNYYLFHLYFCLSGALAQNYAFY